MSRIPPGAVENIYTMDTGSTVDISRSTRSGGFVPRTRGSFTGRYSNSRSRTLAMALAKTGVAVVCACLASYGFHRQGGYNRIFFSHQEANGLRCREILVELDDRLEFKGALALKSEKIIYCPIQKVACTEWLKVFRWIDGQDDWEQPRHEKHGLDILQNMRLTEANDLLNSPEWLKFAVVREPAERLLSCFLQKCNKWNFKTEYRNCPYLELWPDLFEGDQFPDGPPSSPSEETLNVMLAAHNDRGSEAMFAEYVSSITRRVDALPCSQNPHWAPQWCHCSLDITLPMYTIVGWANMSDAAAAAIVPAVSTPKRAMEIAEFLAKRMGTNSERKGKRTAAGESVEKMYSEEALRQVHEAYAKDYALFSRYWEV